MRRAGCLVALATVGVLAAALHGYRQRDYRPVFSRIAGELVMVRDLTQVGRMEDGAVVSQVTLVADNGFDVRLRVRVPADLRPGERRPAALLIGGFKTGIRAAETPSTTDGIILASIDYPYDGPRGSIGTWGWVRHFGEIRRGVFDTPAALLLAAQYLYSRPDVEPSQVSVIGVSLGVPFATAAAATDRRLAGVALLHGGGDIQRMIRTAYADRAPAPLLYAGALAADWILSPLDPVRYADDLAPRPVLMVNATGDGTIPRESVLALYESAARPKRLIWVDSAHVAASDQEIVDDLLRLTLEWMDRYGLR